MKYLKAWCALPLAAWLVVACDDDSAGSALLGDATSSFSDGAGGGGDGAHGGREDTGPVRVTDGGVTITDDAGTSYTCYPTTCAGKLLQCGDCTDNDGDGVIDSRDKECLGPCDNTEGPALIGGVGGNTGSQCGVDCYFDFGNGPGNDDCTWDHRCDRLEPETPRCALDEGLIGGKKCPSTQSNDCNSFCIPYTPNGCDCFGCCTFPQLAGKGPSGGAGYVWIGAFDNKKRGTCTFDDIEDPAKCPPCTPVAGCNNRCGRCEICIGKPTVPADCLAGPTTDGGTTSGDAGGTSSGDAGGGSQQCTDGRQPCGLAGQAQCPASYYCISGCCTITIL